MANQTVTTSLNYDASSISGLLDGETISINGGSLTINSDVRWNQQAAVLGNITLSATLGGNLAIDGTTVWELPFSSSTGNVPTQVALGSNGVTGGTSGATGELMRVWSSGELTPRTAGGAMPATGYVKLRTRSGTFQSGETVTLPGGATIVLSSAGKRSWLHIVGAASGVLTQTRLSTVTMQGDWYELGSTNGADDQIIQLPVREEITAVQIETSAGSGVYEWWANGGDAFMSRWFSEDNQSLTNLTRTKYVTTGPSNYPSADRVRETTANNVHHISHSRSAATGSVTFSAIVKQETRQWCVVQVSTANDANRFGALVDLSAGTIIANPSVGSPTGTASAITSLGSGWYKVDVTISHTSGSFNCYLATANSATPTYSGGLPTYTGTTTEGMFIGFMWFEHATLQVIPTDARGKFFFSDGVNGTLLFAKRTGVTAGAKPPSGCKIRIPNIFLGTSNSADWSATQLSWVNRYSYSMTNAAISIDGVNFNWLGGAIGSEPAAATIKNSTWTFWRIGGRAVSVENVGMGLSYLQSDAIDMTSPVDLVITKSRFTTRSGFHRITTGINITLTDCIFDKAIQSTGLLTTKAPNSLLFSMNDLFGGAITNCAFIGGRISCLSSTNVTVKNMQYADNTIGDTISSAPVAAIALNGFNITVDGFSSYGNLSNVHPYNQIVQLGSTITNSNINIVNIGSLQSPWDAGSANACGNILTTSSGTGFTVRRCFASNLRSAPISFSSGGADFRAFDVRASAAVTQGIDGRQNYFRGGFFTPSRSVLSSPGSHWIDAFTSNTAGAIVIYGNEPTISTASQCSTIFGVGSGFNGSGSVILSKTTDNIVWATPSKFYGHTAFGAGGCSLTGTDLQNVLFEYQIDAGSFTFLCNSVRQSTGGGSGTNTISVTAADRAALARQPQVGDYIQTSSGRLPAGTTITGISTNTITCSANFTSNVANNELITFSNVNVAVSPSDGYELKVRARPFVSAVNLFSNIQIGIATNAAAIQCLHPLPGSLLNVTNLVAQSRVKVTRLDTGALLGQASSGAGTSVSFDFQYTGAVLVEARNASSIPAYIPWSTQVSISPTVATKVVALQQFD